jgi:glycosyltransferase involved in cell wall biosynthesis
MEAPFGVSVVICCHNSARRLPATLMHLGAQKVNAGIPWEVVLVDNASTDDTATVAKECWSKHPAAPLRIIGEPRLGPAFARKRGMNEARYEFISFVDDDNWVDERWVEPCAAFLQDHPAVGAVGASSTPVCEVEPPAWFWDCNMLYAISPATWRAGDFTDNPGTLWTAGMTLRKTAVTALESSNAPLLLSGRRGSSSSLAAGEDTELTLRLRLAGWKLWYEPSLHFRHYLPTTRLTWSYARRLYRGSGEAAALLTPYAAVLESGSRSPQELRKTWEWQFLQTVRHLLARPDRFLRAASSGCEGDMDILGVEQLYGRLVGLLRSRSGYYRGMAQIKELARHLENSPSPVRHACSHGVV